MGDFYTPRTFPDFASRFVFPHGDMTMKPRRLEGTGT